jgi:CheY-like chemotaxis protein
MAAGQDEQRPAPERAAPRLLIAEADPANQRLLEIILSGLGYEITLAGDGLAAVQAAEAQAFDLALVDLGLPVIDGLEVARRIRATPGGRDGPAVVAITSHAGASTESELHAAGVAAWLTKPIDITQLAAVVTATAGDAPGLSRSGASR